MIPPAKADPAKARSREANDESGVPMMNRFNLCVLVALGGCVSSILTVAADAPAATPALDALSRFTAPDVPASGAAEQPVDPFKVTLKPDFNPATLPGKGLAQHPMLYVGESFNKMFVINDGNILWTYSTGKGGEYDDAWLMSNGNILFSRMGYAEEITPQKKVVWHLTRQRARRSTRCSRSGWTRSWSCRTASRRG